MNIRNRFISEINQKSIVILIILVFVLVTFVLYFTQSKTSTISNIKKITEERTNVLNDVTKLVGPLPENPTLYKLDNVDQLAAQLPFFKGADSTDFLLVFPTSKQILLYSPTQKKVLSIGSSETDLTPKKQNESQVFVEEKTAVLDKEIKPGTE